MGFVFMEESVSGDMEDDITHAGTRVERSLCRILAHVCYYRYIIPMGNISDSYNLIF